MEKVPRKSPWRSLLLLMLVLALIAAACGGDDDDSTDTTAAGGDSDSATTTEAAAGGGGGEIVIAIGSEPSTLDPHLRDDGGERAVNDNIYETLLARDSQGQLQPSLAATLPTQIDETTWEVTIRDGVSFTNGNPLEATNGQGQPLLGQGPTGPDCGQSTQQCHQIHPLDGYCIARRWSRGQGSLDPDKRYRTGH